MAAVSNEDVVMKDAEQDGGVPAPQPPAGESSQEKQPEDGGGDGNGGGYTFVWNDPLDGKLREEQEKREAEIKKAEGLGFFSVLSIHDAASFFLMLSSLRGDSDTSRSSGEAKTGGEKKGSRRRGRC